ncbi:MAG: hypothetical protein EYC70_06640 [Planctomycetota bacterium]|nr:MAG: hypothetical protein EYC70_06640 [Planctomycetota bacterium]
MPPRRPRSSRCSASWLSWRRSSSFPPPRPPRSASRALRCPPEARAARPRFRRRRSGAIIPLPRP